MSKKESDHSDEEKRAYVEAVIRKQAKVDEKKATDIADKLSHEKRVALHDHGRAGRVSECREILGLDK